MQKALQQAILQETQRNNDTNDKSKPKPKPKNTKTITSGDIFSARTLESRFVLTQYEQRMRKPNTVLSMDRNLLRRGRASFPKKHKNKFRKKPKKCKSKSHKNKEAKAENKPTKLLRYQRRKPFHLLREKCADPNKGWLITHLWHAKRCKMEWIWGYKLAMTNNQNCHKSFRNTLKQTRNKCTLYDSSVWSVIALIGKESQIIQSLLPFIAVRGQRETFAHNQTVLRGNKEMELFLYKPHCYPFQFLCFVKCLWNGTGIQDSTLESERICWLWCHCSVYKALFQILSLKSSVKMRNESRAFVRYELRGQMSGFVLQSASQCFIPDLGQCQTDSFLQNGTVLCAELICNPKTYAVKQPFLANKLKKDFVLCHSPTPHSLRMCHEYRANNQKMNGYFHSHFKESKECKTDNSKPIKKSALYKFPFLIIARRFGGLESSMIGWDVIIPNHSTEVQSFIPNKASISHTSIARFWFRNLNFGGATVIGLRQKLFQRLEFSKNNKLFPFDFVDCKASVHYWLKYYKFEWLKSYFQKPKSKRVCPLPMYPFCVWPNVFNLFPNTNLKNQRFSDEEIHQNIFKSQSNTDSALLNQTLFGVKDIHFSFLKYDTILSFDDDTNENNKYFIVRDPNILTNIKECLNNRHNCKKIDFASLYDWNDSIVNCALVLVNIEMCTKGVPSIGNPMFIDNELFGYVLNGGYSRIKGCAVGLGIVKLTRILLLTNQHKMTIAPFCNYPMQRYQCNIQL